MEMLRKGWVVMLLAVVMFSGVVMAAEEAKATVTGTVKCELDDQKALTMVCIEDDKGEQVVLTLDDAAKAMAKEFDGKAVVAEVVKTTEGDKVTTVLKSVKAAEAKK